MLKIDVPELAEIVTPRVPDGIDAPLGPSLEDMERFEQGMLDDARDMQRAAFLESFV